MKSRTRTFLIITAMLCFLLLVIWGSLSASIVVKYVASGCATVAMVSFIALVYYHTVVKGPSTPDISQTPVVTDRLPVIPPQPIRPPHVVASEPDDPVLYDYRARPIPAIVYTMTVALLLAGLLLGALYLDTQTHTSVVWYIFTPCAVAGVALCYWQWIVWRGIRLIVTKSTKQLQRVLPWPFNSSTPTMPNRAGAAQDVTQKTIDRLFGTCRLFSNIKAEGDEVFHNLKWYPHPDELRHALGIPPLRKNSWWLFSKRNS